MPVRGRQVHAMTDADRDVARRSEDSVVDGVPAADRWRLRLVAVRSSVYDRYYGAMSNPVLWFLQHRL